MHMGVTTGKDTTRPFLRFLDGRMGGTQSSDGRIAGTYVHGLFAEDPFRTHFLAHLNSRHRSVTPWNSQIDVTLDTLADHLAKHLDTTGILNIARRVST